MADFLTDEEQAERIRKAWRDYGLVIVLSVVLAIGGVIGWNMFQEHRADVRQEAADLFAEFENARGLMGPVDEIAQTIHEQYPNSSYEMFVYLYNAKDAADENEWEKSLGFLEQAHALAKDKTYQDMIRLRIARVEFQLDRLDDALASANQIGEGYEMASLELKGDIHRAQSDFESATTSYEEAVEMAQSYVERERISAKLATMPRTSETELESNTPSPEE
ncbi:MAG: tetratricopeptide repeat protein [Gammaproteobacteria bacterium]|nr:tetratricopeptide repeat protein [Gammaproteobacteria bacterium]